MPLAFFLLLRTSNRKDDSCLLEVEHPDFQTEDDVLLDEILALIPSSQRKINVVIKRKRNDNHKRRYKINTMLLVVLDKTFPNSYE